MLRTLIVAFALALSILGPEAVRPAQAEDNPLLGSYKDWQAFRTKQDGKLVCLVSSKPLKTAPTNVKRGDIFILISFFQDGNVRNQVQVLAGYPFKAGSTAKLTIGKTSFDLFTDGENAWARDSSIDAAIVKAMRAGATAVVKGTSQRGTDTTDTYSLSGITAALNRLDKDCKF